MSDLSKQLRHLAEELPAQVRRSYQSGEMKELPNDLMEEAADEIERLRAQAFKYLQECGNQARRADNAEAECDKLREQLVKQSWQAIETAPKDKPIMLCVAGYLPCTGRWWPVDGCWSSFDWEGHFESDQEASEFYNGSSYEPTHWMPLPPTSALTDEEDKP